ncbi:hypothetical protein [Cellulomonas composti]|uniref:Uncharacterized protein n=1 Tax=Cellulomonas composti TaxID=266130 RepID=A0A511JD80_9CELL|nr:hypothetical protein [Cellulomonas composti]GEL95935.1 hypothetical protein CCO02nite_25930 [Cellulomonas composti]
MAEGPRALPSWLGLATQVAAPLTVVSATLFYFGYVFTSAQFAYFGVDVATIGLTTQDFVLRSPQPLVLPLLVLTAASVGATAAVTRVERRVTAIRRQDAAIAEAGGPSGVGMARVVALARRAVLVGCVVIAIGLALLLAYPWWRDRTPELELVSTLAIALGAVVAAVGLRHAPAHLPGLVATLWAMAIVATLWSVSTAAEWAGTGRAHEIARTLDELPAVILDTPQDMRLQNTVPPPDDLCFPAGADGPDAECAARTDEPRYRYRGLRLLVQGPDAMFLVPDTWSASATTLVVPDDSTARVQFQFQNDAPD